MLREASMLAPNSSIVWKHLGYVYHYAGLTDLAEAAFRRGRDLDPVLPQAYWMHGRMLLYQGKANEAEQEVRRALERFPNQFKLMMFLGYFLYQQGSRTKVCKRSTARYKSAVARRRMKSPLFLQRSCMPRVVNGTRSIRE